MAAKSLPGAINRNAWTLLVKQARYPLQTLEHLLLWRNSDGSTNSCLSPPAGSPGSTSAEATLRSCLSRLLVVHCSSSAQLLLTLHLLETSLSSRPSLALLLIDSISAFYWLDRSEGGASFAKQEENLSKCSDLLARLLRYCWGLVHISSSACLHVQVWATCPWSTRYIPWCIVKVVYQPSCSSINYNCIKYECPNETSTNKHAASVIER